MNSSPAHTKPQRLTPQMHARIWGATELEPWFPNPADKIGEVWFPQAESPVLVKFIFTTENLSVQVHPGDAMAQQDGHPRGKTEMWHILKAAPNAKIALGFESPLTPEQLLTAAQDGSIMHLLRWLPVHPGQTWFVPAGAVHAIGAGVTLCEVQQNSDVTYRLFDYGRGRELHLEQSLRAADLAFRSPSPLTGTGVHVNCQYFQVARVDLNGEALMNGNSLLIALEGSGELDGEPFRQGEVFSLEPSAAYRLSGNAALLTVTTRT